MSEIFFLFVLTSVFFRFDKVNKQDIVQTRKYVFRMRYYNTFFYSLIRTTKKIHLSKRDLKNIIHAHALLGTP